MDEPTTGARIRAARSLHDWSVKQLADAIGADRGRGLGIASLRLLERDAGIADYAKLSEIAHACGLPVEWFTADFDRLAEISDDPRRAIAEIRAAAKQSATAAAARARRRRDESRERAQGSHTGADDAAQG